MTDAKHEAPAEGAGEALGAAENLYAAAMIYEDQAMLEDAETVLSALRARSSAPEAREEALGNLLAVIHGDGGHRALEVGTKQAALEAEKIVARLLSSAPEAREGEAVAKIVRKGFSTGSLYYTDSGQNADLPDGTKLYTHPAAPSADKLRIAVEAMQGAIEWDKRTGYRMPYRVRDPLYAALDLSTPDALKGDAK